MNELTKKIARFSAQNLLRLTSSFDRFYLHPEVPTSYVFNKWEAYVDGRMQKETLRVLEIGSREVTGPSKAREKFGSGYVGFDYYPGRNVDVVGDVHRLSSYFQEGEQFDLIYSVACFEHFAMPWIVAPEIARMLKIGGMLLVATHFSFNAHERPWNFFQFSDMGLRVLFSSELGFECVDAGMSNPLVGRYSGSAQKNLRYLPIRGLYSGSEYMGRKVRDEPSFDWKKVDVVSVVDGTTYPAPKP